MAEYFNSKELPDVFKVNDRVVIAGVHLNVGESNLFSLDVKNKVEDVFKKLLIFNPEKFCKKIYGYEPKKGYSVFPRCRDCDYQTLTKVVKALMERDENPPIRLMIYRWSKKKKKKTKEKDH